AASADDVYDHVGRFLVVVPEALDAPTPPSPTLPSRPSARRQLSWTPLLDVPNDLPTEAAAGGLLPSFADARSLASSFVNFVLTGDVEEDAPSAASDAAARSPARLTKPPTPLAAPAAVAAATAVAAADSYFAE